MKFLKKVNPIKKLAFNFNHFNIIVLALDMLFFYKIILDMSIFNQESPKWSNFLQGRKFL